MTVSVQDPEDEMLDAKPRFTENILGIACLCPEERLAILMNNRMDAASKPTVVGEDSMGRRVHH